MTSSCLWNRMCTSLYIVHVLRHEPCPNAGSLMQLYLSCLKLYKEVVMLNLDFVLNCVFCGFNISACVDTNLFILKHFSTALHLHYEQEPGPFCWFPFYLQRQIWRPMTMYLKYVDLSIVLLAETDHKWRPQVAINVQIFSSFLYLKCFW